MSILKRPFFFLFLLVLLSSCELLSQLQLYPSTINSTVTQREISELFGIYKIYESDSIFDIEYLETRDRDYLLINSYRAKEGFSSLYILDAHDLSTIWQSNDNQDLRTISVGLQDILGEDNDLISRYVVQNYGFAYQNVDNESGAFDQLSGGFFLYQPPDSSTHPFGDAVWFVKHPSNQDAYGNPLPPGPLTDFLAYGNVQYRQPMGSTDWVRTFDGTASDVDYSINNVIYINFSDAIFASRSINDLDRGLSYIMGIIPTIAVNPDDPWDVWQVGKPEFVVYTVEYQPVANLNGRRGPVVTGRVSLGSHTGWANFWDSGLSFSLMYYTRKGWVTIEENQDNGFALRDGSTGVLLDKPLCYFPWEQDITFSYDGNFAYYIDPRTLMLVKGKTPW